jgi:hypothetical protein
MYDKVIALNQVLNSYLHVSLQMAMIYFIEMSMNQFFKNEIKFLFV